MLYLWEMHDENETNSIIGEYDREKNSDRFLLRNCKEAGDRFGVPIINFEEEADKLNQFDCLANNARIPLISNRLASFLNDNLNDEIELIPALIHSSTGDIEDYFFLNILNCVDILDRKESTYICMADSENIRKYKKIIYKEEAMQGLLIARDNDYKSNLIVSGNFKKNIESEEFCNVHLIEVK